MLVNYQLGFLKEFPSCGCKSICVLCINAAGDRRKFASEIL
jgi:hypothetical protein